MVDLAGLDMITCENGLGRMLAPRCASRFAVATGLSRAPVSALTKAQLEQSRCKGCEHGQARYDAGEHKERVTPLRIARASSLDEMRTGTCSVCSKTFTAGARGRMPEWCAECRLAARDKARAEKLQRPLADPAPVEPPRVVPLADLLTEAEPDHAGTNETTEPASAALEQSTTEERPMRKTTCIDCEKEFRVDSDTGRMPTRCPSCKGAAPAAQRPARRKEALAPKGGGSRTGASVGELSIEDLIERASARTALCANIRALVSEQPKEIAVEALAVVLGELRTQEG